MISTACATLPKPAPRNSPHPCASVVREIRRPFFGGYALPKPLPYLQSKLHGFRSGTVGQFLPGIQYQLVPIPGIAAGGMLHVKGPNLMSGYLRFDNPGVLQPPASPVGEGWYETGDVVEIDDEGFVKIVGRVKALCQRWR